MLLQAEHPGSPLHLLLSFFFGHMMQLEAEGHVVGDVHVGIEGIVLKHHGDIAVFGINAIDPSVTDVEIAATGFIQPCHHAQDRAFAGTRGSDQHHKFVVIDGQVEIMHHLYVAEGLVDMLEANTGHSSSLLFSFLPVQTMLYKLFGKKITWVQEHGQACVTADGACVDPQVRSTPYTQQPAPHASVPLVLPALRLVPSERPHACDHPPGRAAARLTCDTPGGSATQPCFLSLRTAGQLTSAVRCEEQPGAGPAPRTEQE